MTLDSHNPCYVNPFVQGLRSPPRLPYTSLPELLHPLTRGSAGGQTEAGDIIGSHIQQFHGYTATKLIVAELQLLQVGEVAQFRRYRPAQGNGKRIDACRVKQIPAQCSLHIGWVWKAPVVMVMGYSTGFSDRSWYA